MRVSAVVFDFDNVILLEKDGTGSDEVKESVWPKVFPEEWERLKSEFPAIVKKWSGGKGSRTDILRDALTHFAFEGDIEKEVAKRSETFNRLVQDGIFEMGSRRRHGIFLKRFQRDFHSSSTPLRQPTSCIRHLRCSGSRIFSKTSTDKKVGR